MCGPCKCVWMNSVGWCITVLDFPLVWVKARKGFVFWKYSSSRSSSAAELPAAAVFAPPCRALLVLTLHFLLLPSDNLSSSLHLIKQQGKFQYCFVTVTKAVQSPFPEFLCLYRRGGKCIPYKYKVNYLMNSHTIFRNPVVIKYKTMISVMMTVAICAVIMLLCCHQHYCY